MMIRGSLLLRSAHCKRFLVENFLSPFFAKKSTFGAENGLNVTVNFCNPKKAYPCVILHLLSHHASKSVEGSDLWVVPEKRYVCVCMYVSKNNSMLYFTHLPRSPPWKDLHLNWCNGLSRRHNQL